MAKGTTESFKKEVFDLVGDEYTVLGEYVNTNEPILMRHNVCGNDKWKTSPNNFKHNGRRCPRCSKKEKGTTESFKQEVYDLVGDEYTVLGEYVNTNTQIKMRHNVCGYDEWYPTPNHFKNTKRRCPNCSKHLPGTTESFKQEVFDLVGDEYTVLGEYVTNKIGIKMRHNKCGHEWSPTPDNFKHSNTRCPKCNESKGEKIISDILDELKINYVKEKTFPDCKYIQPLRFDFYIESINLCIEYDGIQHFDEKSQFVNENLELIQLRDSIKNNYCKDNGINLKRFNYKQFNNLDKLVRDYILKEIKKHG